MQVHTLASELVSHSAMHDYVHHKRSKLKGTRCIHVKMTFDYFCRRDFPAEPLRPRQAAATSTQAQLTRPCTDYSPLLRLQRCSRPTRPDDTGGCCWCFSCTTPAHGHRRGRGRRRRPRLHYHHHHAWRTWSEDWRWRPQQLNRRYSGKLDLQR